MTLWFQSVQLIYTHGYGLAYQGTRWFCVRGSGSFIKIKINLHSNQSSDISTWMLYQSLKFSMSETKLMCLAPEDAVSPTFPVTISCFLPPAPSEIPLGNPQHSIFLILEAVSQGTLALPWNYPGCEYFLVPEPAATHENSPQRCPVTSQLTSCHLF